MSHESTVASSSTPGLQDFLDSLPIGVVATDAAGAFTLVNRTASALFGGITGTAYGPDGGYTLHHVDGSPLPTNELPLVRALERGETVDATEILLRQAGGAERTLLVSARPLVDRSGRTTGSIGTLHDITARRDAETERARTKDEFLAMVSHELRGPLNAIIGWAHVLRQEGVDPETTAKAIDTITRNANTQVRLINDLFDMARIVSGQLRLDVQECELIPVIEGAIDTVRFAAAAKRIRLEKQLDPDAEPILGDPIRMQQVVWNLLSNAIKFTPEEGRVAIRLERAGRHVRIVVVDNGPGIPREALPYVFDRFRRATADPRARGLGLGLAIVKNLVELHGGTVTAESDARGATFVVLLPWWNPKDAEDGRTEQYADLRLDGLRVLLVDDDRDTRELLVAMLKLRRADVVVAASATDALAAFAQRPPDVLISDIRMPLSDGYQLIRSVRALPPERGGAVPAIALTALARPEDHRRALDAGYQVHVPKPVTPAKLDAVLGFILRQRRRS